MGEKAILIIEFGIELVQYWFVLCVLFSGRIIRWWLGILAYGLFIIVVCLYDVSYRIGGFILIPITIFLLVLFIIEPPDNKKRDWNILCYVMVFYLNKLVAAVFKMFVYFYWKSISLEMQNFAIEFVTLLLLFPLGLLYKKCRLILQTEKWRGFIRNGMILLVCFVAWVMAYAIVEMEYVTYLAQSNRNYLFHSLLSVFVLLSVGILMACIFYIQNSNEKIEQLMEAERQIIKMQENYYEMLLKKEESTRNYRHDMNNLLMGLVTVAEQDGPNTLKYVEKLHIKIKQPYQHLFFTGNKILDVLLDYYMSKLGDDVSVQVTGKCYETVVIPDIDICIIFSNLIQNAVEALKKLDCEDKFLNMQIRQGNQYFQIIISNRINRNIMPVLEKGVLKTMKRNQRNHGIGMKNVIEAVERNEGRLDYYIIEDVFFCKVTFDYAIQ